MKEKISMILAILCFVFMIYVGLSLGNDFIMQDTTGGVMVTNTTTGESSIIMKTD